MITVLDRRLNFEEIMELYTKEDIHTLAYYANRINELKNNNFAFFIVNRHINYTNICINRCKFCAFSKNGKDEGAYLLDIEEILQKGRDAKEANASELHIVGGLHPEIKFEYIITMLKELRKNFPGIHLQAFTAVEIDYFAKMERLSLKEVLKRLINAGLDSIPGGGAEIFNPKVRARICSKKITGRRWLEIHRVAHKMGLRSNATMLYGHEEDIKDRIQHLIALRELQDETGGFMSFIPLPFHPANTDLSHIKRVSAIDDLKVIAISRIVLDNFDNIKSFWIMLGVKLAQISLYYGADDLDGTVVEEKITHSAGARTPEFLSKNRLISLIKETGRIPVERDTIYNIIKIY